MGMGIGILCSGQGLELAAVIEAVQGGRLAAEIRLVLCDTQNSEVLNLARSVGIYATFVPRGAYHANLEGYERRLIDMLRETGAELVVMAGFARELGGTLEAAYPGRVIGRGLEPSELVRELEKILR